METRLGVPLGDVRIHSDARAATAAHAVGANALTMNRDIVFAQDRYRPSTADGKRLLAHELAHVAQTKMGAPPDVVHGNWHPRGVDSLRDSPGMILCLHLWALPPFRTAPNTQRWVAKVEYFAPINVMPSYGVANEYWAVMTFAGTANVGLIVSAAHAAAWDSTRFTFPSTQPSAPTPGQAFWWFHAAFESDIRGGLAVAGAGATANVSVTEDPPPGCPCP
jgi:hypothetical protein